MASSSSDPKPNVGFVLSIVCAAAMGGFLFGFDTAVINGAVKALQNHFHLGETMTGLAVSLALLGSAAGALAAGPLADRYGRIRIMLVSAILFTISGLGSGLPFTIYDFIFWRLVGGIAVGAASVLAPAYISEVAPAHLRGRLASLQQMAIVIGISVALISNYWIASVAGSAEGHAWWGIEAWRWMFWMEIPPALIYGISTLFIPESPRYLVAVGRHAEAKTILARILGALHKAEEKVAEIAATITTEQKPRFSDLRGPAGGLLAVVWIGIGLSAFQQFCGINVIFYYSSVLWQAAGFSEQDSLKITMITGLINIATTILAILFVDRFGRRPLLLIGSLGMTFTLGIMALVFGMASQNAAGLPQLVGGQGQLALWAANGFVFFFGFSWGPVVWVLLGEMFPNRIRAAGLSLATCVQWIANFAISTSFPPMQEYLGLGLSYAIYAAFSFVSFFFVWILVRETKGKELEEMK
ncbi:MAG: sugar porter family MFS transporter [Verrucomicrobiae bacterium]|nr:sugar porter family MFS transporter [Verrucomicrobiae bacterium]